MSLETGLHSRAGGTVQAPLLSWAGDYPLSLCRVSGWTPCLGETIGSVKQLTRAVGCILWPGSTISWAVRLPCVTLGSLVVGGKRLYLTVEPN